MGVAVGEALGSAEELSLGEGLEPPPGFVRPVGVPELKPPSGMEKKIGACEASTACPSISTGCSTLRHW